MVFDVEPLTPPTDSNELIAVQRESLALLERAKRRRPLNEELVRLAQEGKAGTEEFRKIMNELEALE